jgi:hypothetical protein
VKVRGAGKRCRVSRLLGKDANWRRAAKDCEPACNGEGCAPNCKQLRERSEG